VTYTLVALVVGVAAAIQAVGGFGFSLLAVPLLAVVVGAKTGVVANGAIGLGLVALMASRNRRGVAGRTFLIASVSGLAAMPLGLLVLTKINGRALTATIGASVVVLTWALARGLRFSDSDFTDAVAGLCSGALATSTGTNGPPLVLVLHGKELEPSAFRATLAAIFLVQSVAAFAAFAIVGRVTAQVGRVALAGYPTMVLGLLAGERFAARIDGPRFRRIVLMMLVTSAVVSFVGAWLKD